MIDITYELFPLMLGMPRDDFMELQYLGNVLNGTRTRNKLRSDYYTLHSKFKDLGVAIPARFQHIEAASGWGAKAVDHLARRVRMEAFTAPDDQAVEDSGLNELWFDDNNMALDLAQGITSTLIHSPGFLMTTKGDPDRLEPEAVISAHDAVHATGRWNWSRRGLDSALVVTDTYKTDGESEFNVSRMLFFMPGRAYELRREMKGGIWTQYWDWERVEYDLPRIPVEPMLYHPMLARPFGGSRITRSVMYLIDAALRTLIRNELTAEFYSGPQRYGLNVAEEDVFKGGKTQWDVMIGKMLLLGASENPDDPDPVLGQFPQMTMQPHAEMFRMLATAFSGETGVPITSLGVVQDNPSSAEAIYAGKEDLVLEAEEFTRFITPAVKRSALNAIMIRDNIKVVPDELKRLSVRWIDPSTPSRAQSTDAVTKQVQTGILPAESDVTLELVGHSQDTIERVKEERRLMQARETVRAALAVNVGQQPAAPPAQPAATEVAPPQQQSVPEFKAQNPPQ